MNATRETPGADDLADAAREPVGSAALDEPAPTPEQEAAAGGQASVKVTVALVLALWVGMALVLAISQVVLNRGLGIDVAVRSLPDVWDWAFTFVAGAASWGLVWRRHPRLAPDGPASRKVTFALVAVLWAAAIVMVVTVQTVLNRSFGLDLTVGELSDVWDWVLTIALIVATWVLIERRHPRADP